MSGVSGLIGRRQALRGLIAITGLAVGSGIRLEQQRLLAATQSGNIAVPVISYSQGASIVPGTTGWVFPGFLSTASLRSLPRPPVDSASLGTVQSWVSAASGAWVWYNSIQLFIQTGTQSAILESIKVTNLVRHAPLDGTLMWVPQLAATQSHVMPISNPPKSSPGIVLTGAVESLLLSIDLDARVPLVESMGSGAWPEEGNLFPLPTSPFFSSRQIDLKPSEVTYLIIVAGTTKYFCSYSLLFSFLINGQRVATTYDLGTPFRVTAGAGFWVDRNHPDYSKYEALYVAIGAPPQNWAQQNPLLYPSSR
jgi:hypothetical protein